nr:hypothetical protein BaRGS_016347 [Batillaria attramentaria]
MQVVLSITGFGFSFMYGPGFVLLGKYFKRHLTLATAIANTGVSVGGVVIPIVIRFILDEFSFPSGHKA